MSKNIVFEGWLTKSPPAKRIWRAKWRRRWFSLRQSGDLPGQYFLDYFADRHGRKLKGRINLDLCQQVDAGLHMERRNGVLDPKLRGLVFTVRTQSRTYHLEADCESDMEKWVDAICKVCGLRATQDASDVIETFQNNAVSTVNNQYESDRTGPYIPISECITGVRCRDAKRKFTFDPIETSNRKTFERISANRAHQIYTSQPQIRLNVEFSENESNISDEDCRSLNASHSHIGEWPACNSFTQLEISPKRNGFALDGPPVPPRPPKTLLAFSPSSHKEAFHGPKIQEPLEADVENASEQSSPWLHVPRRMSYNMSPTSPGRPRPSDDDDDASPSQPSLQYLNMPSLPPAVDRALKPRPTSHSIGHIHSFLGHSGFTVFPTDADVLQYLDLDLQTSKPAPSKPPPRIVAKKKIEVSHEKSFSAVEADSAYKTVDFVKTEALHITRQDAEASRNTQH